MTAMAQDLLYLSAEAVAEADISLDALREACAAAYAVKARGGVRAAPKVAATIAPGHAVQAMPVALPEAGLAALKWVAITPPAEGRPGIAAQILLTDLATGETLAIMDGGWITGARTAAMSALAAERLARRGAASIGFVGCGLQARTHLAALRHVLPRLARIVAYSRTEASAVRFLAEARAAGLEAETTRLPREAVEGLDVVVSSVPDAAGFAPFLDPGWLAPGAFASAVDLGRSWRGDAIRGLDLVATDDHRQSEALGRAGKLAFPGPFDADLAELASGAKPGRTSADQRAMFLFAGDALADLAGARLVYETARQRGLGIRLPR
jgi:ornithine cyclodeaminase/alanine dehydrogenase-like protein (mu-crystallin family)